MFFVTFVGLGLQVGLGKLTIQQDNIGEVWLLGRGCIVMLELREAEDFTELVAGSPVMEEPHPGFCASELTQCVRSFGKN